MAYPIQYFWAMPTEDVLKVLHSSREGLSNYEAEKRIKAGYNSLRTKKRGCGAFELFISQFKSPIILILFFAIILSFFLRDTVDALIILTIILISGLLGFWQEYGANNAVSKLLELVRIKTHVLRDGKAVEIGVDEIIPGDILLLKAGAIIPADCLILESNSLNIDEATLTGETFPVEKQGGVLTPETPLGQTSYC
ncbi:MAG: HAD-IC family P-type ATPase [Tepidanaerobacteraceae bacterium]|nr:HAD-IC family P-type ATPase [Tepidanaerobacteraceae bacterium]